MNGDFHKGPQAELRGRIERARQDYLDATSSMRAARFRHFAAMLMDAWATGRVDVLTAEEARERRKSLREIDVERALDEAFESVLKTGSSPLKSRVREDRLAMELRTQARLGKSQKEAAKAVGRSPGRVSQIAGKHNISFQPYPRASRKAEGENP